MAGNRSRALRKKKRTSKELEVFLEVIIQLLISIGKRNEALFCILHTNQCLDGGSNDIAGLDRYLGIEQSLVCRLCHLNRLVEQGTAYGQWQ